MYRKLISVRPAQKPTVKDMPNLTVPSIVQQELMVSATEFLCTGCKKVHPIHYDHWLWIGCAKFGIHVSADSYQELYDRWVRAQVVIPSEKWWENASRD